MKTGKVERKTLTPTQKKPLSASQTPKSSDLLKKQSNAYSSSKDQTPKGYNLHMRNNSELTYKSLHDALSHLSSQANTPSVKHDAQFRAGHKM